jgi:hypothetical protein
MELKDKIKTALDETRMLILGVQVLLGFQFRGAFENAAEALPTHARAATGSALALMLVAAALIITPSAYHRIALGGTNTGAFHDLVGRLATAALLPFAASLGLDLFIAVERMAGTGAGAAVGGAFTTMELAGWYGAGYIARRRTGGMNRRAAAAQADAVEDTPLHTRIEQMLTEARVILPGVQALLGFQLAIVLTESFERLPASSKLLHGLALGCVAVSIILLMTPAAYHRIVYAGEDTPEFLRIGGALVAAATVPLALGLVGDAYVVFTKITDSATFGTAAALLVLVLLAGLWYAYPAAARRGQRGRRLPKPPPPN